MTVMLLQRSATPQLTHIQKTANQSAEPPFLFLLDVQENRAGSSEPIESRPRTNSNALLRYAGSWQVATTFLRMNSFAWMYE